MSSLKYVARDGETINGEAFSASRNIKHSVQTSMVGVISSLYMPIKSIRLQDKGHKQDEDDRC
jgi:hypothetical protein